MAKRIDYQQLYMDLQDLIIDLLAKDKESGLVMKELLEQARKKQEREVFDG